jgi:hypothetical protein
MITDSHLAMLSAVLAGDVDAFDHLERAFDLDRNQELPAFVAHAFVAAARRRFPPGWSNADVIRFVGQLRARNQGEQSEVDSGVAEQMLYSALRGEPMGGHFGEFAKGYAQFVLLAELVSGLDARQIDTFLEEARERADRWLASQTCP